MRLSRKEWLWLWLCLPVASALKDSSIGSTELDANLEGKDGETLAGQGVSSLAVGAEPTEDGQVAAAPVKEVIRVLKALAKRVDVRDRREKKLHEEFGSYCAKGDTSLEKSLKESQSELPHLQLALVETERKRQALQEEIKAHENDAASCKSALQTAEAIRADETQSYKKELATLTANQERLQELLAAQEVGASTGEQKTSESAGEGGKFVQTGDAAFQRLTLSASSAAELIEMLQAPDATAGQKIQVLEMLKNMLGGVKKDMKELKTQEAKRAAVFAAMQKAKTDELKSLQRSLQQKGERDAAFQKQMATIRMERQDTAALVDDADKLGKSLQNWCTIRHGQHTSMQMEMQEEQKALQSAAKLMLSGTDLEIFKPESLVTFLQVAQRHQNAHTTSGQQRALRGKPSPALEKITKLVDSMVSVLEKAQEDDNLKIQMCKDETASTEEAKAALSEKAQSKAADIATLSEQLETLERDVAAEKTAITRVDWVVAKATELREKEHKHLATSIAQGAAAVDVMHKAMNSLQKYLDEGGTLDGPKPKKDDEEFGFLLETTSGTDTKAALRSLQAVIDAVRSEVEQVKLREAADQAAYVELVKVARASRRKDAYTLTDFVGGQAALTAESQRIQDRQKALKEQMGLTDQLASTLKAECDKLIANYKAKKQARTMEMDVLKSKKSALEASLADVDLE